MKCSHLPHGVPWGEVIENRVCFRCMRSSLATVTAASTYGLQSHGASARWPLWTCGTTVERACKPEKWGKAKPSYTEKQRHSHLPISHVPTWACPPPNLPNEIVFNFIFMASVFIESSKGICFQQQCIIVCLLILGSFASRYSCRERAAYWIRGEWMQLFQPQ